MSMPSASAQMWVTTSPEGEGIGSPAVLQDRNAHLWGTWGVACRRWCDI